MKRKTLDLILTAGGGALMLLCVVAGALLLWGASFANSEVHNQLAQQDVFFPAASAFAHLTGHEVRATMRTWRSTPARKC
jgi:hypothetical protein